MSSCKESCPIKVKNALIGCNGRPEKYKNECPRLKVFLAGLTVGRGNQKGQRCVEALIKGAMMLQGVTQ